MKTKNFVAIDFETATHKQMPCQLGLVVVRNGRIVEEKQWLIKPPGNEYHALHMCLHGIRPEDTEFSPEFDELWDEIKPCLDNKVIVCHNRVADITILNKVVEHYHLPPCSYSDIVCTMEKFCGRSLEDTAAALGIELRNHHDALCDARTCAEIYLSYINNIDPTKLNYPPQKSKKEKRIDFFNAKKLSAEAKTQDLSIVENRDTPFYDKSVVITGILERFPVREDLAMLLRKYGAKISSSISQKTDYVITGKNPGPTKIKTIVEFREKGEKIMIIEEPELYNILDSIK